MHITQNHRLFTKIMTAELKEKAQGSEILEIELQHCINDR